MLLILVNGWLVKDFKLMVKKKLTSLGFAGKCQITCSNALAAEVI